MQRMLGKNMERNRSKGNIRLNNYEAMAEKEDIRYQDKIFEEMKEGNCG